MQEFDLNKIINEQMLKFGNDRFIEGFNGALDEVVKVLQSHLIQIIDNTTFNNKIMLDMSQIEIIDMVTRMKYNG